MSFKYSQLAYFCALVEQGSIHAAAEKMCCVPSNITNRIKDLEHSLKISLFNREQRKLCLTAEGRLFYQHAKQLLEETEKTKNLFKHKELHGHLRIGALDFVLDQYLYPRIKSFIQRNKKVQVDISVLSSIPLISNVLSSDLDLIVVDGKISHPFLASQVFCRERLFLVCKADTWEEFECSAASLTLYSYGISCLHHDLLCHYLSKQNIRYARHCAIESYRWIFQALQDDSGFSVIPEAYVDEAKQYYGLNCYAFESGGNCDVSIVWQKNNPSPLLRALVTSFDEVLSA